VDAPVHAHRLCTLLCLTHSKPRAVGHRTLSHADGQ
jgi:hypothetical protein